jgi:multiple sugar transport system permease protein
MFCIAVIGLSPIIWVVMTSFKPALLTFAIPPVIKFKPSLDGYGMLFFTSHQSMGLNVAGNLTNSIITSVSTTFLTMIIGCFAAFSLLNFRFRFRKTILFAILASRMLPPIGTIIPFFLLINSIGLMDTKIALIMAYTALNLPLTVWMLRGFMADIPGSLIDAGLIDGCSYFSMLFLIYLPVVMPGIVATSVFTFLQSWNDFSIAIAITQSNYSKTLPLLAMSFITEEGIQWAPMAAAITLTIIPPIVFVLLTHKGLAKGMTFGAVKE